MTTLWHTSVETLQFSSQQSHVLKKQIYLNNLELIKTGKNEKKIS